LSDSTKRPRFETSFLKRPIVDRISTGSQSLDELLGGQGLPTSCITDVYGPAGTGKTQFAFQNAIMTCHKLSYSSQNSPLVVFVDCGGSFRPERIVEIADSRSIKAGKILERIYCVNVRNVQEQKKASFRIESDDSFENCRLIIVDDITSNFMAEFDKEDEVIDRQRELAFYSRHLSYLANKRSLSVLFTNSVRFKGELGEGETAADVLSAFALFRVRFSRKDRKRIATMVQPLSRKSTEKFEIETAGIL